MEHHIFVDIVKNARLGFTAINHTASAVDKEPHIRNIISG